MLACVPFRPLSEQKVVKGKEEKKRGTYLLVHIQLPENLRRIQQVLVINDLLGIPRQQRQIQQQRNPVPVDEEEEGQKGVDGGFGDDVGVEAVAEVDGVDVIAAKDERLAIATGARATANCSCAMEERHTIRDRCT